jgi:hypothetical protein
VGLLFFVVVVVVVLVVSGWESSVLDRIMMLGSKRV